MIKQIILFILVCFLIFTSGCANQNNSDICNINQEYKHTAVNPINCTCPEGYVFEVISRGWGPCPEEGITDCPMSIMKCVQGEL